MVYAHIVYIVQIILGERRDIVPWSFEIAFDLGAQKNPKKCFSFWCLKDD